MVKNYLISLKNKGNFTWSDLSEMSGLPEATIRKIFSGETADPRFETVAKLVSAMGGSLDEIIQGKKASEIETNAVIAIKESYEARISDLKASALEHITSLKRDKKILCIAIFVLTAILVLLFALDFYIATSGWIKY